MELIDAVTSPYIIQKILSSLLIEEHSLEFLPPRAPPEKLSFDQEYPSESFY